MAIGWLSVLKWVPWGDVISNAPKIADSAKRLWRAVTKSPTGEMPLAKVQSTHSSDAQAIAKLQAQLVAALTEISELHTQMLASSELIKALAEQNTQLIKRIELNRIRVLWLASVVLVLVLICVIDLALAF